MRTTIIGYPRIGEQRELKFASEKYFHNEIDLDQLWETASRLRASHWGTQKRNGIDIIPSNDFSLYDNMLDTAVLLNIIPEKYRQLHLSETDTYFAMARGYQGDEGDVKALAMKKWFNTNYHYMVPEIDDTIRIHLAGNKPIDEYLEARKMGIETKPVVIGPFTFMKLARFPSGSRITDYISAFSDVYSELVEKASKAGAKWIQFDEPCLVMDQNEEDKVMFAALYKDILSRKGHTKIALQTYFGDVRDSYTEICDLSFDGIGLDFVEGKKSMELVAQHGFPEGRTLITGIINGKNIWRNHYASSVDTILALAKNCKDIVLSTSCSLLHVPYSLRSEKSLAEDVAEHFSFAEEKVKELAELGEILSSQEPHKTDAYVRNVKLFAKERYCKNERVIERVDALTSKDFARTPSFSEREQIQKRVLNLPLFPTTTIGSFPQTRDVRENRSGYKKGSKSEETYNRFLRKKISECVAAQERIGLDVLVHGEFERNDMVEYFGERLSGFIFTENAWVLSYGTRCVKPPIIWGDVERTKALTVNWITYAQSLTEKPVKGMITGPVTIVNWSFPREDISLKESVLQIGLSIRDEVLELERNHIRIIQIDEAALREKLPLRKSDWQQEYLSWAIPAFRLVHSKVKPQTQIHTHMCYSEFKEIIREIDDMDADVITFEASRSDLTILSALRDNNFRTEIGPGVYDIHSPRVPSVEEMKMALNRMLETIPQEKLWVNPDCGLKTRGEKETWASLSNLVKAAKEIRNENI